MWGGGWSEVSKLVFYAQSTSMVISGRWSEVKSCNKGWGGGGNILKQVHVVSCN